MWHDITGRPIAMANAFGLMGIVNVTPDSFYAPSRKLEVPEAARRAGELLAAGADIIDLGAESTRPGADPVDWQTECARLLPVLKEIRALWPHAVISVDTRNARTAAKALDLGAAIINDVSACRHDPAMLSVLADYRPGYVLMHARGVPKTMQQDPRYTDVIAELNSFFYTTLEKLEKRGLPLSRVILDPGFGFGKTADHNMEIIRGASRLETCGRPLLAGISMKSFISAIWNLPETERGAAGEVLTAFLFQHGYQWHRVHDVAMAKNALLAATALQG